VTTFLDISNLNLPVELVVMVGAITGDDTVVTMEESTGADSTSAVSIGFTYRFSPAMSTDSGWGDVTTCDSAGMTLYNDSADNKMLFISIGPENIDEGYKYLKALFTTGSSTNPLDIAAFWFCEQPRYASLDAPSDT
jgi:hypothetical protein